MKCNQSRPGFELVSPCPFPKTITTTPRAPPKTLTLTHLPEDVREHMTHSDTFVKCINDSIATLGEVICDITIGDQHSPAFKEVNVLITSAITPILTGQNILRHSTLNSYTINNHDATVKFKRSLTSGHTMYTAPLTLPLNHTATSKHDPVYGAQTTLSSYSCHKKIPLIHSQTLEDKLHRLKRKTGSALPDHSNCDELESVTDLL